MTVVKSDEGDYGAADEPRRGRGRPQLRSDEETRALILEAARYEFSHSGYAATSMENVARRASVSTKTLYRLVPNKAALFEAMVTERTDGFISVVKLRACDGGDIEAALTEALLVCAELMLDGDVIALQRVILATATSFRILRRPFIAERSRGPRILWRTGCGRSKSVARSSSTMRMPLRACCSACLPSSRIAP